MFLDPYQNKGGGWYRETSFSPSVIILLTVPRRCFFFVCFFCYLCLSLSYCHVCFLQPCGQKSADLLAFLHVLVSCVFVTFSNRCPGSGVVLDCIDY